MDFIVPNDHNHPLNLNFLCKIRVEDYSYINIPHYIISLGCKTTQEFEEVLLCTSGSDLEYIESVLDLKSPNVNDLANCLIDIVTLKFLQNDHLAEKLIEIEDEIIYTDLDKIVGVENFVGMILMDCRDYINRQSDIMSYLFQGLNFED